MNQFGVFFFLTTKWDKDSKRRRRGCREELNVTMRMHWFCWAIKKG